MGYEDEDIEFAERMLNCRDELDEDLVKRWMADVRHVELLDELAAVRNGLFVNAYDDQKDHEFIRLQQVVRERKSRRMTLCWSVAASVILLLGLFITRGTNEMWDANEIGVAQQSQGIKPRQMAVELTLADGKVVKLDRNFGEVASEMEFGIRNDSVRGLSYMGMKVKQRVEPEVYNTLTVPACGFYQLELADGTKVWLNSATELRYPVAFAKDQRKVYLSGEAYFEVKKDVERLFLVITDDVQVKVYGTQFNVNTQQKGIVQTTLIQGKVGMMVYVTGQEVVMRPDEMVEYHSETGVLEIREVDPLVYTAWKSGKFVFVDERLENILEKLRVWYDVDVVYLNEEVKNLRFTGNVLRFSDIGDILGIMEKTATVEFVIKDRTIVVNSRKE